MPLPQNKTLDEMQEYMSQILDSLVEGLLADFLNGTKKTPKLSGQMSELSDDCREMYETAKTGFSQDPLEAWNKMRGLVEKVENSLSSADKGAEKAEAEKKPRLNRNQKKEAAETEKFEETLKTGMGNVLSTINNTTTMQRYRKDDENVMNLHEQVEQQEAEIIELCKEQNVNPEKLAEAIEQRKKECKAAIEDQRNPGNLVEDHKAKEKEAKEASKAVNDFKKKNLVGNDILETLDKKFRDMRQIHEEIKLAELEVNTDFPNRDTMDADIENKKGQLATIDARINTFCQDSTNGDKYKQYMEERELHGKSGKALESLNKLLKDGFDPKKLSGMKESDMDEKSRNQMKQYQEAKDTILRMAKSDEDASIDIPMYFESFEDPSTSYNLSENMQSIERGIKNIDSKFEQDMKAKETELPALDKFRSELTNREAAQQSLEKLETDRQKMEAKVAHVAELREKEKKIQQDAGNYAKSIGDKAGIKPGDFGARSYLNFRKAIKEKVTTNNAELQKLEQDEQVKRQTADLAKQKMDKALNDPQANELARKRVEEAESRLDKLIYVQRQVNETARLIEKRDAAQQVVDLSMRNRPVEVNFKDERQEISDSLDALKQDTRGSNKQLESMMGYMEKVQNSLSVSGKDITKDIAALRKSANEYLESNSGWRPLESKRSKERKEAARNMLEFCDKVDGKYLEAALRRDTIAASAALNKDKKPTPAIQQLQESLENKLGIKMPNFKNLLVKNQNQPQETKEQKEANTLRTSSSVVRNMAAKFNQTLSERQKKSNEESRAQAEERRNRQTKKETAPVMN